MYSSAGWFHKSYLFLLQAEPPDGPGRFGPDLTILPVLRQPFGNMNTIPGARALNVMQRQAHALTGATGKIPEEQLANVEDVLCACTGRVLTSGAGTSGIAARKITHTLNCVGRASFFLDPTVAVHGSAGAVQDGDVLILFSKGGETDELVTILDSVADKSIVTIGVTEQPDATIGRRCHHVLAMPPVKEADDHDVIATTSILLVMSVFDGISMSIMERTGYSLERFARTHPGGAVGKRFRG